MDTFSIEEKKVLMNEVENDGKTAHLYFSNKYMMFVAYGISAYIVNRVVHDVKGEYDEDLQMPMVMMNDSQISLLKKGLENIMSIEAEYLQFEADRNYDDHDLRNSSEDQSQRMLNAIEPGSVVPIHRHQTTSETVVCLRGRLVWEYYDELERICTDRIELKPNGPVVALNVPAGQWHTVKALESGSVILEVKDGPYEPQSPADILD